MSKPDFEIDPIAQQFIRNVRETTFTDSIREELFGAVDKPAARPNDRRMTDINRQQVADMLAASEAKVDAKLANFDTSIKTGFADLRAEFAELRTEIANGRTDAAKQTHESVKWIIGSVFGMISLAVAIIGVLINLNKAEKPTSAPAAQPAAIVVTVPGATVAAPQSPPPTSLAPATK